MDVVMGQGPDLIEFYRNNPCIALYELLGVDLAPVQRIVFESMWFKPYNMIVAGRGAGKSTYIHELSSFQDKGLVYLSEELPQIPTWLTDGEDTVIDYNETMYTSEGFKPIKKLCLEKCIKGKKLTTQNRLIKRGSNHHPLLTIDSKGRFIYKNLDEFSIGDRLCIQRNQQVFGKNDISEDDSYLIGLLIGDGNYNSTKSTTLVSVDESIITFCVEYCIKNNISYSIGCDKRSDGLAIFRFKNDFSNFFVKHGITRSLSYYKSVPYSIRTATKEAQVAFLQGYFDTDGTASSSSGEVSCCSVSTCRNTTNATKFWDSF